MLKVVSLTCHRVKEYNFGFQLSPFFKDMFQQSYAIIPWL
jgi:hypothetical protein